MTARWKLPWKKKKKKKNPASYDNQSAKSDFSFGMSQCLALFQGGIQNLWLEKRKKNTPKKRSSLFLQPYKRRCTHRNSSSQNSFFFFPYVDVRTSWATSSLCGAGRTVSSISIHHARSTSNSCDLRRKNSKQASPPSPPERCHSHISRQRLMGMERCVTASPCIKKDLQLEVGGGLVIVTGGVYLATP